MGLHVEKEISKDWTLVGWRDKKISQGDWQSS